MLIFSHIPKTAGYNLKVNIQNGCAGKFYLDYDKKPLSEIRESLQGVDIVYGHYYSDKYNELDVKKELIMFLRNPTERVISHYYFSKYNHPNIENDPIIELIKLGKLDLVSFANLHYMKNFYKRFFGSNGIYDFSFIGITEKFDESIGIINNRFGTKFTSSRENITDKTKDFNDIKKYYIEIEKSNEENNHYYNLALKTFWNQ